MASKISIPCNGTYGLGARRGYARTKGSHSVGYQDPNVNLRLAAHSLLEATKHMANGDVIDAMTRLSLVSLDLITMVEGHKIVDPDSCKTQQEKEINAVHGLLLNIQDRLNKAFPENK